MDSRFGSIQRGVSLKNLSTAKVVRRSLLYVGLAIISFASLSVLFALSIYTGVNISRLWLAFAMWTGLLCWIGFRQFRDSWRKSIFWVGMAGLLALHTTVFTIILRNYPDWHPIWFIPIVIVEAGVWGAILEALIVWRSK